MPTDSQRKRLYQNTVELFYNKGFKATTMRDIASSMDFEAASLYNYIKSKDALLEELLFEVADQFLDGILLIKSSGTSSLNQLQAVIKLYVQITSANPYKASLLTTEWRNLKEPSLGRFIEHRTSFEGHLKEILIAYFSENGNVFIDVNIALHAFLGSTRWIYDWNIKQKESIDILELEKQLTYIILHGLVQSNQ